MKALITMRESKNQYGDLVDSLEQSYINFWYDVFNIVMTPVPNRSSIGDISVNGIDLVVLSGGGSVASKYISNIKETRVEQSSRDLIEMELIKLAVNKKIPVIGVCRGMQFINCTYGGSVSSLLSQHKTSQDHEIVTSAGEVCTINSYHNDGVLLSDLAKDLIPIAVDKNNRTIVEAFGHKSEKILGIQWHPERPFSDINGYYYTLSLIRRFL